MASSPVGDTVNSEFRIKNLNGTAADDGLDVENKNTQKQRFLKVEADMQPAIKIQKILCPVDFSNCSKHALEYALAFAEQYDSEICILHAVESPATAFAYVDLEIPEPDLVDEFRNQAEKQLDELAAALRKRHGAVSKKLVFGKPFAEIIDAASEWGADLIVLGTHGRSALEHILIGSVAEKVVRKANCPVLTVRHPEHEFVHP